jgi:hypothetical protein
MKRFLTGLLFFLTLADMYAQSVSAGFAWKDEDGGITITRYTGTAAVLSIPNSINGKPVSRIGDSAFANCAGIIAVVIPSSVVSIGDYAFSGCVGLTSIVIPNSVSSIGDGAFSNCNKLTSVTIPNSVTFIGSAAFQQCGSLTGIIVDGQNPNYISNDGVLFDKLMKTLIQYPGGKNEVYIIPNSVVSVGRGAFYECDNLISVTIPESVTAIGDYAFQGCDKLTRITIANSDVSIGEGAFVNTNLKSINLTRRMQVASNAFDDEVQIRYIDDQPILDGFHWKVEGNSVTITGYTGDADIAVIPNNINGLPVSAIGEGAFLGCAGVTSVIIPASVGSIGNFAFAYCRRLTKVTIPNSVASIGEKAFTSCESLKNVILPAHTKITVNSFDPGVQILRSAPKSVLGGFHWKAEGDGVTITRYTGGASIVALPDKIDGLPVTRIGDGAFLVCRRVTNVTIPDSVTSIGDAAFSGCSNLTSITIPDSVTSIGGHTFYGCESLTSVTIPNSVRSIGNLTFSNCTQLTSITIPDSVESLGEWAFYGCNSLASVSIGKAITALGKDVFWGCDSLKRVILPSNSQVAIQNFPQNPEILRSGILSGPSTARGAAQSESEDFEWKAEDGKVTITRYKGGGESVVIPEKINGLPVARIAGGEEPAFGGCVNLISITIPSSVIFIDSPTFSDCPRLTSIRVDEQNPKFTSNNGVLFDKSLKTLLRYPGGKAGGYTIPSSVVSIGDGAFSHCGKLTGLVFSSLVGSIGNYAFADCPGLKSVTLPRQTQIASNAFDEGVQIIRTAEVRSGE